MINRSAIVIRAKEPFVEWLRALPDPCLITTEEVNRDSTVYLIPQYVDDDDKLPILKQCYDLLFEDMLCSWWTVEADWPADRSLDMFQKWFEVDFHSVLEDLVDDPLLDEY